MMARQAYGVLQKKKKNKLFCLTTLSVEISTDNNCMAIYGI